MCENELREKFEKLSEITEILKNKAIVFVEQTNKYYCYHYSVQFINGAWLAYQEQQKIINSLMDELMIYKSSYTSLSEKSVFDVLGDLK